MLFTIAIPAYKASYLKEAIDSCLRQTCDDFELIILNDHSPENISNIVERYNDPHIRYYVNDSNCGALNIVDNWNKCLSLAKGDYILCIGDDDRLTPQCLQNYQKLIQRHPTLDAFHTRTEIINGEGKTVSIQNGRPEHESAYSLILHRFNNAKQYLGDFLFRTKVLRTHGGYYKLPLGYASDDITAIIMAQCHGIANTVEIGFQYRNHGTTISNTGNICTTCEAIQQANLWYKNFLSQSAQNEDDEKIRHLLLESLVDNMKHNSLLFLMNRDMDTNLKSAYRWWKEHGERYGIENWEVTNEYKQRKREQLRLKIRKTLHL